MAKFANVRYGSRGEGPQNNDQKSYTYVVADTVRTGDAIIPIVSHWISKKIFATEGVVQSTAKSLTTKRGAVMAQDMNEGQVVKEAIRPKDVGVENRSAESGKFIELGTMKGTTGVDRKVLNVIAGAKQAQKTAEVLGGELTEGEKQRYQTFDEYSAQFIGGKK